MEIGCGTLPVSDVKPSMRLTLVTRTGSRIRLLTPFCISTRGMNCIRSSVENSISEPWTIKVAATGPTTREYHGSCVAIKSTSNPDTYRKANQGAGDINESDLGLVILHPLAAKTIRASDVQLWCAFLSTLYL